MQTIEFTTAASTTRIGCGKFRSALIRLGDSQRITEEKRAVIDRMLRDHLTPFSAAAELHRERVRTDRGCALVLTVAAIEVFADYGVVACPICDDAICLVGEALALTEAVFCLLN